MFYDNHTMMAADKPVYSTASRIASVPAAVSSTIRCPDINDRIKGTPLGTDGWSVGLYKRFNLF